MGEGDAVFNAGIAFYVFERYFRISSLTIRRSVASFRLFFRALLRVTLDSLRDDDVLSCLSRPVSFAILSMFQFMISLLTILYTYKLKPLIPLKKNYISPVSLPSI